MTTPRGVIDRILCVVLGLVPIATGALGFCPASALPGISP